MTAPLKAAAPLPSPSLADGYRGSADAAIFEKYDHDVELGVVHVQATFGTKALLKRAGFLRVRPNQHYAVPVRWDADYSRLQISPVATGPGTMFSRCQP